MNPPGEKPKSGSLHLAALFPRFASLAALSAAGLALALVSAGCARDSRAARAGIEPEATGRESGYLTRQGLQLFYETQGQGPPLLLLSGGPGYPPNCFEAVRALAPHVRLIFLHQRGTGKSDKAKPDGYTIEANVEDLEQLRRHLGLESFMIFGHSWGGMLAQAYAVKYPARVSRLILANTFSSITDLNAVLARMRQSVPEATRAIYDHYEREGLYQQGRDRYPKPYEDAVQQAYESVFCSVPLPDYLLAEEAQLSWDVYRAMWGEETEFKVTGTLARFDVERHLGRIRSPTLVIVGAHDMPTIEMARQTARAIPNARLEVFEHSRHFPFIEEPDKFLKMMREFLRSEPGSRRAGESR